ncbi:G-type lectin S-receptor-like serine/threonine-protein kinase RLK1 [Gossypium australe]|uniref:G-type lectin S-receptor-like serine/threonine-protein kinase RLK1 n=1 Tax=Gossypium australe TaxID=47621 RepID=A0A5B6V7D1_9ROSI|nr:G-type lectin S-receptor-like serine/threonine-protein kinase RLK1 [Gossypium australe]
MYMTQPPGFEQQRPDGSQLLYILVYVDDIIVTRTDFLCIDQFVKKLDVHFSLKDLGQLSYFLGIEVTRTLNGVLSTPSSTTLIAVKKLDNMIQDREKEFVAEASATAKTHHRYLVRLLSFCNEGRYRLLAYEFMSNGTLASFHSGISKPDCNK